MYLRFEPAAWVGEAAGKVDGWDDGAPEGVPGVLGGRCTLMPPLWEEDAPEGALAAGTSGMKSETTVTVAVSRSRKGQRRTWQAGWGREC